MTVIVLLAFAVALLCEAALAAGLIWSILLPERRIWPPQHIS